MYFQVQIKNVLQSLEIDANHAFFIAIYTSMFESLKQKLNNFQMISQNWYVFGVSIMIDIDGFTILRHYPLQFTFFAKEIKLKNLQVFRLSRNLWICDGDNKRQPFEDWFSYVETYAFQKLKLFWIFLPIKPYF